jgi:hypothetical protein
MFIRLKFPAVVGSSQTINYMILQNFQFSRTTQYDAYELSQIFGQDPMLMMLLGSVTTFSISGSLIVKTLGSNYYADGLYNSDFTILAFSSLPLLINHLNKITRCWNDGNNNLKTNNFAIEYVSTYNEFAPYVTENFLPESFNYSIASRDTFIINVTLTGKIGTAMFGG